MSIGLTAPAVPSVNSRFSLRRLVGPVCLPGRFALSHPMNLIRMQAGLFYLPHLYQKLSGIDASLVFFTNAGLRPAPLFLGLSLVFESLSMLGLTFGLFVRWIALASAGCMVVAAYAMIQTKGLNWYWAKGGIEYLMFWGLASLAVAYDAWRRDEAGESTH